MKGGMRLPSNPQLQIKLSLKASAEALEGSVNKAPGSYAIFMDDMIFYRGNLQNMIENRRAVYVPKEVENAC
jgi:hypothetical protein